LAIPFITPEKGKPPPPSRDASENPEKKAFSDASDASEMRRKTQGEKANPPLPPLPEK